MQTLTSQTANTLLIILTLASTTAILVRAVQVYQRLPRHPIQGMDNSTEPTSEAGQQTLPDCGFEKSEEQKVQEEVDAQIWREMDEEIQTDLEQNLRRAQRDEIG